jgi:hypothetical protein
MKRKAGICFSIFVLLLMVVLSSGLSFSRYTSTICNTGDESTVITVNKYNLIAQLGTEPQALQHPGMDEQSYEFTLVNQLPDEETATEDLNYTITVDMDWNDSTPVLGLKVPLNMELYIVETNEGEESLTLVSSPVPSSMNVNRIITDEDEIAGGDSINFRLKWNWGTTVPDRDYRFADRMIDVEIGVRAEQAVEGD